ncbi:MAG: ATP synthase F1 subunit delta [Acidobacteriota bacterium]|nr:MAG: ATP synthase F1 subunit delta [Acidobacteriota bacterium]
MRVSATSKKYAQALGDVALEMNQEAIAGEQVREFAASCEQSRDLSEALANPVLPLKVKQTIVSSLVEKAGYLPIVKNFLLVLIERNRMKQLSEISAAYQQVLDERAGILQVDVASARELSAGNRKRIEETMAGVTGRKVRLSYTIDQSLIGGLKLQVGSTVFDGSVKAELENLSRQLSF